MLSHRIRPVAPPLAPHVEHLWMVRGRLPGRLRNMILPDGAMELIVNLGDPQRLCAPDDPERQTVFRSSWVSGERTEPIVIAEAGYVHLVGIRLRAGGAWPFLGVPLREFSDQVVELDTILGPRGERAARPAGGGAERRRAARSGGEVASATNALTHSADACGESCAGNYSTGSERGADRSDGGGDWDQP